MTLIQSARFFSPGLQPRWRWVTSSVSVCTRKCAAKFSNHGVSTPLRNLSELAREPSTCGPYAIPRYRHIDRFAALREDDAMSVCRTNGLLWIRRVVSAFADRFIAKFPRNVWRIPVFVRAMCMVANLAAFTRLRLGHTPVYFVVSVITIIRVIFLSFWLIRWFVLSCFANFK